LITALPSTSLYHLNITSSLEDKGSQSAIQSMVEFMDSGCSLSDLVLGDCYISGGDLELLMKARHVLSELKYLDLNCNNIGNDGVPFLTSLLQESCKLSSLSLAGNTRISNVGAGSLLIAANSSKALQKLNLSACGVTSPLDAAFFEALKTLTFQNNGSLTELDLSHNLISVVDKERLAEEWELNSTGESLSRLKDNLCIFTKL